MISVALASYNGEKYIARQLNSVLLNLSPDDEIIVSDDGSTDNTVKIIRGFNDNRIKIVEGPRLGVNKNFENAIKNCRGDFIFLCDQDDEWYNEKVCKMVSYFMTSNALLIQHDALVVDDDQNVIYESFAKYRRVRKGPIKNWIRNTYHGCCIAFRKELKEYIFPFPINGCFHDEWIGIIANIKGDTAFVPDILMKYYRHATNTSSFKQYTRWRQLKNRCLIGINILFFFLKSDRRL